MKKMIVVLAVLLGTMLVVETAQAWPGDVVVRRGAFGRQRVVVQRGRGFNRGFNSRFNRGFNRGFVSQRGFNRGFGRGVGVSAFGTQVFVGPRFRSNRLFIQRPFFFQPQRQIIIQSNGGFFY